jgi:hypothetical protein
MPPRARPLLSLLIGLAASPALASDTDNIRACIAALQTSTGRVVDEFDATYQRRLLQTNVARWPGVVCEVADGRVWKLSVDGTAVMADGWASAEARAAFDQLDRETAEAIRTLETRKQLLVQRLKEDEAALRRPRSRQRPGARGDHPRAWAISRRLRQVGAVRAWRLVAWG